MAERKESYSLLAMFVVCIAFILFLMNLGFLVRNLFLPYSMDYGEPINYYLSFQNLYKSFNSYPYLLTPYPPLYFVIFNSFRPLFSAFAPYFYDRLLGLIALVIDTSLLYVLCRKSLSQSRSSSLLASFFFVGSFIFTVGTSFSSFELIFDLAAVLLLFSKLKYANIYAALSLALAFFSKQSALALAPGILLYLVFEGRKKEGAIFIVTLAAAILIPSAVINYATSGRFLFSIIILPLITPLFANWLEDIWLLFFLFTPFIALFLIYASSVYSGKKSPLMWIVLFSLLSALSAAKWGSSGMYFLVPFAFLCAASSPSVISFLNRTSIARPRTLISSLIFAALIYLFLFPAIFSAIHILPPLNSSDTEVGLSLRNFSGNILVEGSSLALAANKSLEFDPVLFWVLQEKGLWNESQLVSDVRSHKFSVIAFPEYYNRFLLYPDLSAAINSSYTLDYTLNSWRVLVPRNSTG